MNIDTCPISGSLNKIKFLDLGSIPLEGNLISTKEESFSTNHYPMMLQFFPESKLISLTEHVDPDMIYKNYLYNSGVNQPYKDHCQKMLIFLQDFVEFHNGDTMIDIGGNDGTLLKQFKSIYNHKLEYINVEASKSFEKKNIDEDIVYINAYFGELIDIGKKVKLITTTNVFQHTAPIRDFVKGIFKNLSDDGVWCLEFPYFITTIINDCYDQAYHEHVYYYTLFPLKMLFEQEGLRIINVSFHDIHGGTLRLIVVKNESKKKTDNTIGAFMSLEKYMMNGTYLTSWGINIIKNINYYREYLVALKRKGHSIAAFGAAIKGCVFLNTCKLTDNTIDYVIDDTIEKQGKFIPGTGIQVVSRNVLLTHTPDYILILAHNFKDFIIKSLESLYTGQYIVMFPTPQILKTIINTP